MSNRMSVLSRRLERYAVGFSIAAFAVFCTGVYVSAKTQGQVVFLLAGLVSVCLFAAFFLWLAHGFAWAMIPEKPVVAEKPAETLKPAAVLEPAEALKPAAVLEPAEALKPAEVLGPADALKPSNALKSAEAMKAAEAKKPVEEKVIAPEDPPDAKYTITGKRIY